MHAHVYTHMCTQIRATQYLLTAFPDPGKQEACSHTQSRCRKPIKFSNRTVIAFCRMVWLPTAREMKQEPTSRPHCCGLTHIFWDRSKILMEAQMGALPTGCSGLRGLCGAVHLAFLGGLPAAQTRKSVVTAPAQTIVTVRARVQGP